MSTDGILEYQGTKRVLYRGDTSNIVFDTRTTSLGIGVTGSNNPSSNLYITGNAYVSSNIAVGGVLTMGTVNVVARYDLERAQQIDRRRGSRFKPSSRLLMLKEDKRRLVQTRRFSEAVRDAARDSCQNARMAPPEHTCQYPRVITGIHRTRY